MRSPTAHGAGAFAALSTLICTYHPLVIHPGSGRAASSKAIMASDLPYRIPREMGASGLTMSIAVAATNPLDVSQPFTAACSCLGAARQRAQRGFGALTGRESTALYWSSGALCAF